jgi:MSHA pilin protein MshC
LKAAGFTLVELVVTIGLAGILAVVAIPRFFDQQAFRERGFYDEALSAARYAQKLAVATGCQVQLTVGGGTYTLSQRQLGGPPPDCNNIANPFTVPVVHPGNPAAGFTGTAPSDVNFTMIDTNTSLAATTVFFHALGVASGNRTVTVGSRTFQIIGTTGYVQTGP